MVSTANHVLQAFVVLNPMAGQSTAEDIRAILEQYFATDSWAYDVYETTGNEDIASIVRGAIERGANLVVAIGGDGTQSAVANGLVHTDIPMGIIPAGTANVLAQELNIPLDIDAACRLLTEEHTTTRIDAMKVAEQYFILHVGIGVESLMIRDTPREAKRRFGRLAYLWTATRWLIGYQPRRFTIVVDEQRKRPRAAQVLVANGGTLGMAPFRWGPDIGLDDGSIDVCVVYARTFFDYLHLIWSVLRGKQRQNRKVRYFKAHKSIIVSSDVTLPIQGDGEIIGETPMKMEVVPQALHVIVPITAKS